MNGTNRYLPDFPRENFARMPFPNTAMPSWETMRRLYRGGPAGFSRGWVAAYVRWACFSHASCSFVSLTQPCFTGPYRWRR